MFDVSKVGYSFPPFPVRIERVKIRELARAVGDDNPIYQAIEAAHAAGYPDIPLSPTFGTVFLFWENTHFVENLTQLGLDVARLMHREEEYEYLAPIYAGDILKGVMTVMDGMSRINRSNRIELVTLQLCYTNQHDVPVLIGTTRLASQK